MLEMLSLPDSMRVPGHRLQVAQTLVELAELKDNGKLIAAIGMQSVAQPVMDLLCTGSREERIAACQIVGRISQVGE